MSSLYDTDYLKYGFKKKNSRALFDSTFFFPLLMSMNDDDNEESLSK